MARRILDRLEIHYTPKHGSWLNMAEYLIEDAVMARVEKLLDRAGEVEANKRESGTQLRDLLLPMLISGQIRLREAEKIVEKIL
ncbi:MAG: hypothetical protein HQM06_12310 [Magnetococcales bacterium]|nr:hypothetical protein [Magnetococcales bacterium]